MPHFCVHAFDHPGRLADRQRLREAHRARLREYDHPVVVRIGGPLTDEGGAMIGTMLVIEAPDRSAVNSFLAGDPYFQAELYRELTVTRFNWGLGLPEARHG